LVWIAGHYEELQERLHSRVNELRSRAHAGSPVHARPADNTGRASERLGNLVAVRARRRCDQQRGADTTGAKGRDGAAGTGSQAPYHQASDPACAFWLYCKRHWHSTLTASFPNEVVIKLLSTLPLAGAGGVQTCNPAAPTSAITTPGLLAWGTSLHGVPTATGPTFSMAETPFSPATLNDTEIQRSVKSASSSRSWAAANSASARDAATSAWALLRGKRRTRR
jgi:hypothetical protein